MKSGEAGGNKHPCPDCRFCQWCTDDRCRICREGKRHGGKLSSAQQIELYERLNGVKGGG